jgi:arylsulfatase A-like enzyme
MTVSGKIDNQKTHGFRYALEAAVVSGAIVGFSDSSYLFSKYPDLAGEIIPALRFVTASILFTSLMILPWAAVVWLITSSLIRNGKLTARAAMTWLYTLAGLPLIIIFARSLASGVSGEPASSGSIKGMFFFLKYLIFLVPASYGFSYWLANLRIETDFSVLSSRISAAASSVCFFLILTPYFQYNLVQSNASTQASVTSGIEIILTTAGIFILAAIIFAFVMKISFILSKVGKGLGLAIIWIVMLLIPFASALFGQRLNFNPSTNKPALSGNPSNVILISLDTVRYDDLGFNGSEIVETPTLDKLSTGSLIFDNAVTPMPVTGPAHMSMLTGLEPYNDSGHGVKSNGIPLSSNVKTLAEVLSDHGYRTGAIAGSFILSGKASGLDQGFDFYHDVFNTGFRAKFIPDEIWLINAGKFIRKFLPAATNIDHSRVKTAEDVSNQAIHWLDANGDSPFFLFVHYYDAHYHYTPPEPYDTMYMPYYNGQYKSQSAIWADLMKEIDNFTDDDFEWFRSEYRGEISYVDSQIRKIVDWGDRNQIWEDTMIIVVSDHGESFEDNYYFNHTDRVYEQLIHIPMLVSDNEIRTSGRAGERIDSLVGVSDIFYTILSYLDVEAPYDVAEMHAETTGANIFWNHDLRSAGRENSWDYVASQSYAYPVENANSDAREFSFRSTDWKLVYSPGESPPFRFYDLKVDPHEENNIYDAMDWDEFYPSLPARLAGWASTQGVGDIGSLSPSMIEELDALGYINPD